MDRHKFKCCYPALRERLCDHMPKVLADLVLDSAACGVQEYPVHTQSVSEPIRTFGGVTGMVRKRVMFATVLPCDMESCRFHPLRRIDCSLTNAGYAWVKEAPGALLLVSSGGKDDLKVPLASRTPACDAQCPHRIVGWNAESACGIEWTDSSHELHAYLIAKAALLPRIE
jgi:hypothetical protein